MRLGAVGCRHAADDGERAAAVAAFVSFAEVAEWRGGIEHFDNLAVVVGGEFSPVGEIDMRDFALFIRRGEAAVPRLHADKAHYLCALVQYDHRHGESKVLEILAHPEEIACEVVVKQEILGIGGLGGVVLEAGAVAHLGVEHLTGGECFLLRKRFAITSDSIRSIMSLGIRLVAPHGIYAWMLERIVGEVPSLDACVARISPSSLKIGFGSVNAAEARALGMVSTEL